MSAAICFCHFRLNFTIVFVTFGENTKGQEGMVRRSIIVLFTVFAAILASRQSGSKLREFVRKLGVKYL